MDLGAVEDFVEPEAFSFTLHGIAFSVAQCDAVTGVRMQLIAAKAAGAFADPTKDVSEVAGVSAEELYRMALGGHWDRETGEIEGGLYSAVVDAKPSLPEFNRICVTAFWWQIGMDDMAREMFTGGQGKAQPPTSAAAATTTPRRASGTGARTKRPTTAKARAASPGKSS